MDFNKEIKLSDLVRRPKKTKSAGVTKPSSEKRKRRRKHEIVGLKIGASQIAASRVVNNGGPAAKLVQLARVPLEPGIVVGGEVRSVAALAAALDSFFTEHKLPRRGIRLGIGTNRIGVRTFDVEGIDDERQLANAVRFRAHEALSIPLDQAVLDYHVVSETVDESGGVSRRVLLAAAYQEQVDHYIEACRAAGLELSGIDVEAFALLRAVAPRANGVDGEPTVASVAVSIGHDRSTLAISDGTACEFMRVLDWGGSKLEAAIARELGLTGPEAAELKLELDLGAEVSEQDDPLHASARGAVVRELQTLARELIASLQFYQGQPGSLAISEVLVTGGTTKLSGLADELGRLTRVPVRVADPLGAVLVSNGLAERDDLASLAVAVGLGIDDQMRAVNLLPDSRRQKRRAVGPDRLRTPKAIAVTAGATLILVAALSGVAFTKARSDVSARQDTLEGLHGEVAAAQAKAAVSAAVAGQTQSHLAAVATEASGRVAWDGLLDQLSRVMPRGAWLESLQATKSVDPAAAAASTSSSTPTTPATSGVPTGFVITGYARSQATVPRVLERLVLMPALSDVTLQSTERTDVGAKKATKFTIGANVRSAGGIG